MTRLVYSLLGGVAVLTATIGFLLWRQGQGRTTPPTPPVAVLAGDSTAALADLDSLVVEVSTTRDIIEGAHALLSKTEVDELATRLRTKAELGLRHAGCRIVRQAPAVVVVHFAWFGQLRLSDRPYYSSWGLHTRLRRPVTRLEAPNESWMETVWNQVETPGNPHEKAALLAAAEKAAQDQLDALVNAIEKRRASPPARRRKEVAATP